MIYTDEAVYEGEWQNDNRQGKGRMIYTDEGIFEGEWQNDEPQGRGKMIYADGSVYEGEWQNNNRQGKGKMSGETLDERKRKADLEKKNLQSFLEVCKAESVGGVCHLRHERVWEVDIFVVRQLFLPVPSVQLPFIVIRVLKLVLPVETARALAQSRIQPVEMVGRSDNE